MAHITDYHVCSHHSDIFNPCFLSEAAESAEKIIESLYNKSKRRVQMIAVCGMSGMIPGSVISAYTGVDLVVIRKPGETKLTRAWRAQDINVPPHCREPYENWLFVDDLISGRNTIRYVAYQLRYNKIVRRRMMGALMTRLTYGETKRGNVRVEDTCHVNEGMPMWCPNPVPGYYAPVPLYGLATM